MRSKFRLDVAVLIGAFALALATGCGRTPQGLETDASIPDIDGPGPCQPSCEKVCDLAQSCSVGLPRTLCMNMCQASSVPPPSIICLQQLVCGADSSCSRARRCISNPDVPDLTVESFNSTSPSRGALRYTARVCNRGSGRTATGVNVHFYRDRSTPPRAGQRGQVVRTTSTLAAGQCATITATESNLAGRTYRTWVQADAENRVLETNENNNVRGPDSTFVQGGQTNRADLIVSLTAAVTGTPGPGNTRSVRYSARVCNVGQQAAPSTRVDLYYNRFTRPTSSSSSNRSLFVSGLSAGQCRSTSATAYLTPGTHRSWAYVDRNNSIIESNEGNNVNGPRTVVVPGGGGLADLRVSSLTSTQAPNFRRTYRITVCNDGSGSASRVYVALYYNRSSRPTSSSARSQTIYLGTIGARQCRSTTRTATLAAGTYRSWAYADYFNRVPETNESNNVRGPILFTVSGTRPDLSVSSFTSRPGPSGLTYYSVRVCNFGGPMARSATIGVYYNRSTPPPLLSTPSRTSSVFLGPGSCSTRTISARLSGGTYRSWVYVDYNNRVQETNESNNRRGPLTVTVGNGQLSDLRISSFNAQVSFNGFVYYYATICNVGGSYAASSNLGIYYNRTTAPTPSSTISYSTYVPALAPGACTSRTVSRLLSGGTYRSWAYIDRLRRVPESNENNNVGGPVTFTVQGGQSDLRILNFIGYQSGSRVIYQATVCNNGTGTATTSRVGVYYNRLVAPKINETPDRTITISTLVAGACTTRSTSATLGAGTYRSWALADYQNQITETNENNNTAGPRTVTVSGGGLADLQVVSLTASLAPTGQVFYNALVCNRGFGTAFSVRSYLFYDLPAAPRPRQSGYQQNRYIGTLTAGSCRAIAITARPPAGNLTSWMYVDLFQVVAESNENNNTRAVKVTVAGLLRPDLRVEGFTAQPLGPTGFVFYNMRVCNRGTTAAGASTVGIYYNRTTAPTAGSLASAYVSVQSLVPNQCASVARQATLQPGTYRSWAYADARSQVGEMSETNNVGGPANFTIGSTTNQCQTICRALETPCNVLPAGQQAQCVLFCNQRSAAQRTCAFNAASATPPRCSTVVSCLFGP